MSFAIPKHPLEIEPSSSKRGTYVTELANALPSISSVTLSDVLTSISAIHDRWAKTVATPVGKRAHNAAIASMTTLSRDIFSTSKSPSIPVIDFLTMLQMKM